jgi:Ca2+/H+ antiporter
MLGSILSSVLLVLGCSFLAGMIGVLNAERVHSLDTAQVESIIMKVPFQSQVPRCSYLALSIRGSP